MIVLEALAILEAATLECKKREADTPELRTALDFLEPHIQPAWLIPQFRHNLDGEQGHDYAAREGQQQIFRATFPEIRSSVREMIGGRMDALAREFAATHDLKVKEEIERLAKGIRQARRAVGVYLQDRVSQSRATLRNPGYRAKGLPEESPKHPRISFRR